MKDKLNSLLSDPELIWLFGSTIILLTLATIVTANLARAPKFKENKAIENLKNRTRSWWVMLFIFSLSLILGAWMTTILFGLLSFLALREFITLTPTQRADHKALFYTFFLITPIQYFLTGIQWYGLYTIFIPVYAFIFIPIIRVLSGGSENFLSNTAKLQWALLVCVYFISHVPMLLSLPIRDYEGQNGKLLFFFIFAIQLSDVMQYVFGKIFGKHRIVPVISPNKTWEGFIYGILASSILSSLLWWATPFKPIEAFFIAGGLGILGFLGGLVMSAIKRDLGAKDWGKSISGHGGILDRIDSLCFAAPLFFHLTGFYYGIDKHPNGPEWILNFLR